MCFGDAGKSNMDNPIQEQEDKTEELLPTFLKMLKVGDELFSTCSQQVFGTIHDIGNTTVDIMVNNMEDLIALESGYIAGRENNQLEKILINQVEVEWIRPFDDGVLYAEFNTVDGCGGCVRRFTIRRNGEPISGKVAVLV